jgi:type IV pilus assembly protein PilY1
MSFLSPRTWLRLCLVGVLFTLTIGVASAQTVSQSPLSAGGNVPGNLVLVPSVEWPTVDSVANLGAYSAATAYVGYFDSEKCYKYSYSATETDRYFYPFSAATSRACTAGGKQWSGNYLNWAATQTIDPFRKALTGGYRVKDTATETWVEKARYDGNGSVSIYPDRLLPASGNNSALVSVNTPPSWNVIKIRIFQLGNKMQFTSTGTLGATTPAPTPYNPANAIVAGTVYEVSVRVKVCDASVGVELNCKQYSQGWKPEGLIQKYSDRIRYSVFGYLNDPSTNRDGGALRAQQKFVGPNKIDPVNGTVTNPNVEWDTSTGVFIRNPNSADASSTTAAVGQTIADSGVMNYLNKFGEMTAANDKNYDPVSELYYSAIRYLKHQGNVPEYTNLSGTSAAKYILADGFPVIAQWADPIQYWCQNNAILGIGDVNTWNDKDLPGNSADTNSEPTSMPATVSADTTINVVTATQKVASLEGITINTPFTGRENSAYIAGLAYDSHTKDMRPDLQDKQTVSTYWVDVREAQVLQPKASNQYWLATKYGGFTVPDNYDPYANTTALATTAWSTSGDVLSTGDLRPDNFYVASQADKMVESLTRAFAKIAAESVGSASSLAANSTRLDTDTRTFQAQFFSGTWRGDLKSYSVASDGSLSASPLWQSGAALLAVTWSTRNIHVYNPQGAGAAKYATFAYANLGSTQKAALASTLAATTDIVDYLRGNRTKEEAQANGTLRTRTGVLGDVVNSTPVFVGAPNARLYATATFAGASSYATFVTAQASRTPVVYVGANDGMLHSFNANTGAEIYAFVPNTAIINGLQQYSDPNYQHRYFVDGEIAVADIYDTSSSSWKTVLVGTLGRGGPGIFALDVTNPANVLFLWEKNGTDISALGKNIGRPVIAQVANGDWRVLLGNGPGSTGASAQLISIGLISGTATVVDTGATGSNGLTAVLARDSNGDGFADTVYAGDLKGNLWKITAVAGTAATASIFQAKDSSGKAQPITAAPLVGKDPASGTLWVFFGTGQYLTDSDPNTTQTQTWYGIKDTGTAISGRSDLLQRSITATGTVGGFTTRVVEAGTTDQLAGKQGWYIDLPTSGERMVVPNRFQGVALIGTTRIPDSSDVCRPSGKGFVMAINPFTGGALDKTFFDLNNDGLFNDSDKLNGEIVSGVGFDSSPNNPIFVENVMQVGLDDGSTKTLRTQGSSVQAKRMSWRELLN